MEPDRDGLAGSLHEIVDAAVPLLRVWSARQVP
jgi:hypothetical protein